MMAVSTVSCKLRCMKGSFYGALVMLRLSITILFFVQIGIEKAIITTI